MGAVLGTQVIATVIAIFGLGLVTPLAWYWALLVWGWALGWFLVNDRAKLLTYWLLDRVRAEESAAAEPAATPKTAPDTKQKDGPDSASKTAPAIAAPPAAKSAAKPAAKPSDGPAAQHPAVSPPPDAKPEPDPQQSQGGDDAKVATLMDAKVKDVLLAAVLKDPAAAGKFIAKAIDDAESSEAGVAATADKPTTPPAPAPKAAA